MKGWAAAVLVPVNGNAASPHREKQRGPAPCAGPRFVFGTKSLLQTGNNEGGTPRMGVVERFSTLATPFLSSGRATMINLR